MNKIIIGSHGTFAQGIKEALLLIVGESAEAIDIYTLQPGGTALDFYDRVKEEIIRHPETNFFVLSDIFGASVNNAFTPLSQLDNCQVIAGVNLPFVLDLLLTAGEIDEAELSEKIDEARSGIKWIKMEAVEEEDF